MEDSDIEPRLQAVVPLSLQGERLDKVLAQLFPAYSRTCLQAWVREKQVFLNGGVRRPRDLVRAGEKITVHAVTNPVVVWQAKASTLDIVYEDSYLLVINKPAGLVVHPAPGHFDDTLANSLLYHCPQLAELPRAGIVHRLDKNTSGLLVVAKNLMAQASLVRQLQAHTVKRGYLALVHGCLISGGRIDRPIGRHPKYRYKMAVGGSHSRIAISHYRILERFPQHTLLRIELETGRTHQIRVHMAYIRHPIVGDSLYNQRTHMPPRSLPSLFKALSQFKRQALHAVSLSLKHPADQRLVSWEVASPKDMQELLELMHENM